MIAIRLLTTRSVMNVSRMVVAIGHCIICIEEAPPIFSYVQIIHTPS